STSDAGLQSDLEPLTPVAKVAEHDRGVTATAITVTISLRSPPLDTALMRRYVRSCSVSAPAHTAPDAESPTQPPLGLPDVGHPRDPAIPHWLVIFREAERIKQP